MGIAFIIKGRIRVPTESVQKGRDTSLFGMTCLFLYIRGNMKITYITGNIFESDIKYILHICNMQAKYNKGFAKQVRKLHPEAYTAYIKAFEGPVALGDVIWAESRGKFIANILGQEFYGKDGKQYVSYDALRTGIRAVNALVAVSEGDKLISMPKLGAGLSGGDWSIIEKIIEEETTDCVPVVYVI